METSKYIKANKNTFKTNKQGNTHKQTQTYKFTYTRAHTHKSFVTTCALQEHAVLRKLLWLLKVFST